MKNYQVTINGVIFKVRANNAEQAWDQLKMLHELYFNEQADENLKDQLEEV